MCIEKTNQTSREIASNHHGSIFSLLAPLQLLGLRSCEQSHFATKTHSIFSQKIAESIHAPPTSSASNLYALPFLDRLRQQKNRSIRSLTHLILAAPLSLKEKDLPSPSLSLITRLKNTGFLTLANLLENNEGYPWDKIKEFDNPVLIEQLVNLHLLSIEKKLEPQKKDVLLNFSLQLASLELFPFIEEESVIAKNKRNETREILGQLIYLFNKNPEEMLKIIEQETFEESLEQIRDAFTNSMQEVCEELQSLYLAHATTKLQDAETAVQTKIPYVISKALLTDIGTINVGIIDTLSNIFLSHEHAQFNHQINLFHALTLLQRSPKLRQEFEQIHLSHPLDHCSYEIIRATLNLPLNHPITSYEAKLTTLTAILSHLRQGNDRSCFAASLAIEMLSSHLFFCFKDFRQMLEEGRLTREVENIKKEIPFVTKINDENLSQEISFDAAGTLIVNSKKLAPLWEAPGLLGACNAMGIEDAKNAILESIRALPPPKGSESYSIEIKTLLKKITETSSFRFCSHLTREKLYQSAAFAFSAQTAQPFLKCWENAIANMAEIEEPGLIKYKILDSTLEALQFKLSKMDVPPTPLLESFFLSIVKILSENIKLRYDPTITASQAAHADTESKRESEGGFILYYDKSLIEGESSFRAFIEKTLDESVASLKATDITKEQQIELEHTCHLLRGYIQSNLFMAVLLNRYDRSNRATANALASGEFVDYSHLIYTPWLNQMGNDSKNLMRIYFESKHSIPSQKFTMQSAEGALKAIIDMCKNMSSEEKKSYISNPYKLTPFCILGKHRLPFMAGSPSLTKAWSEEGSTADWIQTHVINPGREIAMAPINEQTKASFVPELKKILSECYSKNQLEVLLESIFNHTPPLTHCGLRQLIMQQLKAKKISKKIEEEIAIKIDSALCAALDEPFKSTLEKSAIYFADTNWSDQSQDLYLCFVINPGTGNLEVWRSQSDGSSLKALDQNYWVVNQKWEFLSLPKSLVEDDAAYLQEEI